MASPLLTPEAIADNIVYALDVHEKQLKELRKDPDGLMRLTVASAKTPLAGYTKVPGIGERDRFFATMKRLCEREPKTAEECVFTIRKFLLAYLLLMLSTSPYPYNI
jgi:hypothetical protein